MAGRRSAFARKLGVGAAIGIFMAVAFAGCFAFIGSITRPAEAAADRFLDALAARDTKAACALMTPTGQNAIASGRNSCAEGVAALLAGLTDPQLTQLGNNRVATSRVQAGIGYIGLDTNPLRIRQLVLTETGGEWLVTEMR